MANKNLKLNAVTSGDVIKINNENLTEAFLGTVYTGNIDSLFTPGMYQCTGSNMNLPEGTVGILMVTDLIANNAHRYKQIFIRTGSKNSNEQNIYQRSYQNGWGDWYRYAPYNDYVANSLSAVSVPTATWTDLGSVTLNKGRYLTVFGGTYSANSNGIRMFYIGTSMPTDLNPGRDSYVSTPAYSGGSVGLNGTRFFNVTSDNTVIHLYGYQDSGGNRNCYPFITYQKLN